MSERLDSPAARGGFTLLEVLLAIAIIGLIVTTIIGASAHLLTDKPRAPDDLFWQACLAARKSALETGTEARLSYDAKEKALQVDTGSAVRSFAIPNAPDDFGIDLLTTQAGAASSLIGGTLFETQALPYVVFYGDGTCTPFRVQIRAKGAAHVLSVDPWTCARILPPRPLPDMRVRRQRSRPETAARSPRDRGFSLLEVLIALVVFALAAVVLASAYLNILNSYAVASRGSGTDPDVAFAREHLLTLPDLQSVQNGEEFDGPDGKHLKWTAQVDPTGTADLFTVTLTCIVSSASADTASKTVTQTFMLLRPTWSDAAEQSTLRQKADARIAKLQGKTA